MGEPGVVVHAFNPSKQRQVDLCEFKASLVYADGVREALSSGLHIHLSLGSVSEQQSPALQMTFPPWTPPFTHIRDGG